MGAAIRPGHRRTRSGALGLAVAFTVLATAACSGGGSSSSTSARKRAGTSTSTTVLVESKVIGGGPIKENETATFPIDKTLTVVVPVGTLTKGSEVEVREVTGASTDLGAVQLGSKVYSLTIKNGKIVSGKQVSLVYQIDKALPAADPRPLGGWLDESDGVWRPVALDYAAGGDQVTVFAPKTGKFSWLRWSWDKAVQAGADTVRTIVGPQASSNATPECKDAEEVRTKFDLQTNVGNALAWCAGRESGTEVVRIRNNGQAPLAVRYRGFSTPASTNTDPLHAKLSDAARLVWQPTDDEGVVIIQPTDVLTFAITDASKKGLLRAEVNGFSQHYDALGAAAAFVVGFHSGNAGVGAEILDTNAALRESLVYQLAAKGCVNGLGDSVTQATYATDQLAAFAAQLALKCVDDQTVKAIKKAGAATELGNLLSEFRADAPTSTVPLIAPALRAALGPLVEATGGPVAGEIIMSPKGGSRDTPTLAPVGTAAPATPTVAPTATTVAAAGDTTTTLPFATTTQATAPPVGTGTTTTAPAATTTTTIRATTTTTKATTTTTRATTTTTAAPATTTTTTTAPPGPLTFAIVASPCGLTGGTLRSTSAGFRAGTWTATIFTPSNSATTSFGPVGANGSTGWTFNCSSVSESGRYKVSISEVCSQTDKACVPRPEITREFTVNVYDTGWVPTAERIDLGICSGATPVSSPGGSFSQTFVAGGPTISQVGVINREEFSGTFSIWRGATRLQASPVALAPGVAVGNFSIAGLTTGETLRLELDEVQATAAAANNALNFWYTGSAAAANGTVATSNLCAWKDATHLVDPPNGADVLGWIAP